MCFSVPDSFLFFCQENSWSFLPIPAKNVLFCSEMEDKFADRL